MPILSHLQAIRVFLLRNKFLRLKARSLFRVSKNGMSKKLQRFYQIRTECIHFSQGGTLHRCCCRRKKNFVTSPAKRISALKLDHHTLS